MANGNFICNLSLSVSLSLSLSLPLSLFSQFSLFVLLQGQGSQQAVPPVNGNQTNSHCHNVTNAHVSVHQFHTNDIDRPPPPSSSTTTNFSMNSDAFGRKLYHPLVLRTAKQRENLLKEIEKDGPGEQTFLHNISDNELKEIEKDRQQLLSTVRQVYGAR
jgi:hypothetical protein